MDQLIYYYPVDHQEHAQFGHPERPERVESIRRFLIKNELWNSYKKVVQPESVDKIFSFVHSPTYLNQIQDYSAVGKSLDPDTYLTGKSWEIARKTASGAAAVAGQVWDQTAASGFVLARPPGHHAESSRGMGFCLLNNSAIAAEYLIKTRGAKQISIIDLDVHHGNGTQEIFYDRADVSYFSVHQFPFYPGTGKKSEVGKGPGRGATMNIPLPAGSGDQAYSSILDSYLLPYLAEMSPELVLVSIGFDLHWMDPIGGMLVSADMVYRLIASLKKWVEENCRCGLVLILEGGYDLEAAGVCAAACSAALIGRNFQDPIGYSPQGENQDWQIFLK
jgi:acetoin utilization deacetylase AcuC-like enzyme